MLKKLFLLTLLLIFPFFICSCTKNNQEVITFSSWGSVTETKILNKIITDFEKENPNIKINFMHIPQNYFQKLHLLFASSTEPDVVFINNLYIPFYADKLEDLSTMIEFDKYYTQSIKAMSYDKKLLAVPRDISNFVLYYNKSIVKEPDCSNLSFEQFDGMLKKYTDKNHYGIGIERDIFYAEPYILTLGYDKGIEYYKNLEGKYAPNPAQIGSLTLAQMFIQGKLAFYMSGRWMYPKISETKNFPFGIIVFPGFISIDASGWAISKNSKHKDSAKLFIKYLSSKKSIDYFTTTGLIVPARKDSAQKLNNKEEKAFLDAIEKSKILQRDKNYPKKRDKMNKEIFN